MILVNEGNCPTHFLVIYKHRFFIVDAYYKNTDNLLNASELYHLFNSLIQKYETKSNGVGIGGLTSDNRDEWAKVFLLFYKLKFYDNFQ